MLGFSRSGSSRGDGGAEPNRRFVPRLAPSYGRPHHPYAAMMYPDFQYRPPPPSYQASMQEYRLRLLLLERSNPTIAAAATLASPTALTMVPPPPAYRPYNGTMRTAVINRHEVECSRPPSYRSRDSTNSGQDSSATRSRPSFDSGNCHHMESDSTRHSRDPSLLSYLSHQSVAGSETVGASVNLNSTTVVSVMQAVSVGMDLELGVSPLRFHSSVDESEPNGEGKEHHERNGEGVGDKLYVNNCEIYGKNKDGNLVRIVQTTDSSQVIGRDSVIVTVSGSNHGLWDQSVQNVAINSNTDTPRNGSSQSGEVQILAHL